MELSLEQQLDLRTFTDKVEQMSREQAQEFLINFYKQSLLKENQYKALLKHKWGLESDPQI